MQSGFQHYGTLALALTASLSSEIFLQTILLGICSTRALRRRVFRAVGKIGCVTRIAAFSASIFANMTQPWVTTSELVALWILRTWTTATFCPPGWKQYAIRLWTIDPCTYSEVPLQSVVAEKEDICAVCIEAPTDPVALPCSHRFCRSCVCKWLAVKSSCPSCAVVFTAHDCSCSACVASCFQL